MEAGYHWPIMELVPGILEWKVSLCDNRWCFFRTIASNFRSPSREHPGTIAINFLIYINELPEQVDYTSCYPDDTKLLKAVMGANDESQLQQDLDTVNRWCNEWKLSLNVTKCSSMRLALSSCSTHQMATYSISNRDLETTRSQWDLGVVVQKDLLWADHYNKISRKAYMALNLIRRTLLWHYYYITITVIIVILLLSLSLVINIIMEQSRARD